MMPPVIVQGTIDAAPAVGSARQPPVPSCPNGCINTPEGRRAANRYNANATYYYYSCRNCSRCFRQLRPDHLSPGQSREAVWVTPPKPRAPVATPAAPAKKHRVYLPREVD